MTKTNVLNLNGQTVLTKKNLFLTLAAVAFLLVPAIVFTVNAFAGDNNPVNSSAETNNSTESVMNFGPNGTFPTVLQASVGAVTSTTMRVQGSYRTVGGRGIAGMRVDVYSVAEGSFARWSTTYTDSNGNFNYTVSKPPAGRLLQIVVDGNGSYSQPFPTFSRP